jgi:tRNA modification GTPase
MTAATYAACLTPPGRGAIAVIAVRGPDAWRITRAVFRPLQFDAFSSEPIGLGTFQLVSLTGNLKDKVVLVTRRLEPVPEFEIHCHGGHQISQLILDKIRDCGAAICSWQELERQPGIGPASETFGRADGGVGRPAPSAGPAPSAESVPSAGALRAEALIALAEAPTVRTAAILLDQYHGALAQALGEIDAAKAQNDEVRARNLAQTLAARCSLGRHLTLPWRVVIAGAPNVGKSSLVNALAGYQRSIVAPTPGTTRDVVGVSLAIDGWPIELSDTAGLHGTSEELEREGIDRARRALAEADLCVWVIDGSMVPVWPPTDLAAPLLVINKIDLAPAWRSDNTAGALHVSARTGAGLAELCDAISRHLVPEPPPPGTAVPFIAELCTQLEATGE